jgi:hypothetical protein
MINFKEKEERKIRPAVYFPLSLWRAFSLKAYKSEQRPNELLVELLKKWVNDQAE